MHVFLAAITGPLGASVASFRRRLLKNWEMFKMTKFECANGPLYVSPTPSNASYEYK